MLFPQRVYNLSFWNESCKSDSNSFSYERLCKRTRFQTEITTFSYSFVPFYFSPFFHLIYFRSCYILFFDSQWFSTLFSVNLRESILCTLSMIHCTQIPLPLALYFLFLILPDLCPSNIVINRTFFILCYAFLTLKPLFSFPYHSLPVFVSYFIV